MCVTVLSKKHLRHRFRAAFSDAKGGNKSEKKSQHKGERGWGSRLGCVSCVLHGDARTVYSKPLKYPLFMESSYCTNSSS